MNMVEFLVKLKDMASGPLQKFGSTGQNVFTKMEASMDKVSGKTGTLGNNITQLDSKLKQLETSSSRATSSLSNMFRTGLAIAGIGSLAFVGKDIMQAGIRRQMDLTALTTLVGKGPGELLNNQLVDFSIKSPYGGEVMNEGKLLAGSGVGAGKIPHLIQMMGDIALADKERMKSLALGFAEASTRGNLNGQVERMFIQGGLFNPLEQLHLMTKRSLPDLKKDMEKGKISIDMLTKAMEYATGPLGRWHDAMKNAMETPAGKWTAFMGTVSVLAGNIGLKLMPALGGLTDFLNWIIAHGALVGVSIGAMTAAWAAYSVVTKFAAIQAFFLEAVAFWPLAAVGLVAGGIYELVSLNETYGNSTMNAANKAGDAANKIVDANGKIANSGKTAMTHVETFGERMSNWGETIGYYFKVALLGIQSTFERFNRLVSGNIFKTAKHFGDDTEADTMINRLRKGHENHVKMFALGKNDDGTPLGSNPMAAALKGMQGGGADGAGTIAGDTSAAITGGGVRNITINVAKFQDKTEIHTASFKESISEVEEVIRNMFLRVTNSAAAAIS